MRLLITLFGYLIILLAVLGMLAVPLGRLLVGGAITGIIVGIAAQQSLGNIFAGLVLLLARPYVIGEHIRVRSGALGGPIDGTVVGMDLLYTTLETEEGLVRLPNAGLLAAAVGPRPKPTAGSEAPSVRDAGTAGTPDRRQTTQRSGLPDSQHDPDGQATHDDDRPQYPLRDPARHGRAELGPDDRAQREDPRRTPRG